MYLPYDCVDFRQLGRIVQKFVPPLGWNKLRFASRTSGLRHIEHRQKE